MGCFCSSNNDDSRDKQVDIEDKKAKRIGKGSKRVGKNQGKSNKDKEAPVPLKKKKSAVEKMRETAKKSQPDPPAGEDTRRGSSKAVAPPPSLIKKKSTLRDALAEPRKSIISVDVSKFVKEARGDIQERYEVQKIIGKGAYGEVRMVLDKITKDTRAMKVIPKDTCAGVNSSSITNEIEMLKSLDHPSILKIFEFYQDEINYYLITEFCSGGELYDRIISMKNFSETKAAQLMKQILSAVTYCHHRKIVHRYNIYNQISSDIKPENLLFESPAEDANLKVIDFGTSIIFGPNKKMRQKLGTVQAVTHVIAVLHCTGSFDEIV